MGDLPPGVFRVCGKYRLRKKVGSGSFGVFCTAYRATFMLKSLNHQLTIGDVYYANNVITGEATAVKMEPIDSESPKLCHEWKVYKSLGSAVGIPRVLWFGTERSYKAMVMNILGPSLEDLFTACNRTFSLKTVLMLADQLVSDRPSRPSAYKHFFLFYL